MSEDLGDYPWVRIEPDPKTAPGKIIQQGTKNGDDGTTETERLRSVMCDVAHLAATLGSGSEGWLRGRFMSISNALNAAIGRGQSSHGDQYDNAGKVVRSDPLND